MSVLRFAMASGKVACEPKKVFDLEWVSSFMKDQEVQSRAKQILQERCERNHPNFFDMEHHYRDFVFLTGVGG